MERKPNNIRKIAGIKSAIKVFMKTSTGSDSPNYGLWYCGITNNELVRKSRHKYNNILCLVF